MKGTYGEGEGGEKGGEGEKKGKVVEEKIKYKVSGNWLKSF